MPMPVGMGEPEDADPAKIRSVIQGCGEFGINRLPRKSELDHEHR